MKFVVISVLVLAASNPALDAQVNRTTRPLSSVIKTGEFVAVHGTTELQGRVREVTDSSISLVGASAINVDMITSVELRKRKTPNTAPGVVIGAALGAAAAYIVAGIADWPIHPATKILGKFLMFSGISGFFGGVIGSSVHPIDSWETVWSR
jgi:hypothetical protein